MIRIKIISPEEIAYRRTAEGRNGCRCAICRYWDCELRDAGRVPLNGNRGPHDYIITGSWAHCTSEDQLARVANGYNVPYVTRYDTGCPHYRRRDQLLDLLRVNRGACGGGESD